MTTKIEWTDETDNWIVGCTETRAKGATESGCLNCYAKIAANSARLQQFEQYQKVVDGKGGWNNHVEFVPKVLANLLKGKRKRRTFAPSMSDPFHPAVKDEWLDQFFAVVALTPHITYQLLTKRPERMHEYIKSFNGMRLKQSLMRLRMNFAGVPEPAYSKINDTHAFLKNLHLGVSVENQAAADERIPWLLKAPAAVRFLSVEPQIENIDLDHHLSLWLTCKKCGEMQLAMTATCTNCGTWHDAESYGKAVFGISQIIVGGESGPTARPFNLDWARSLRHQCQESGTKFFLKQLGGNVWDGDRKLKLRDRKGGAMEEWPEDLRIREVL